jgi:hypothetical protein
MVAVGFHSHWLNGIDYMGQFYKKGVSICFICTVTIILFLSYLPWQKGDVWSSFFFYSHLALSYDIRNRIFAFCGERLAVLSKEDFLFCEFGRFCSVRGSYLMEILCLLLFDVFGWIGNNVC